MVNSGPEVPFEMTIKIQNAIKSLYKVLLSETTLHYFDSKSKDTRFLVDSSKKGTGFVMPQRCKRTGWNRYIHGSVAGLPILRGRCRVVPYAGVSLVAARSSPKRRYVPLVDNASSSHSAFSARSRLPG